MRARNLPGMLTEWCTGNRDQDFINITFYVYDTRKGYMCIINYFYDDYEHYAGIVQDQPDKIDASEIIIA